MEKAAIITLLGKYWRAETTVEEEKALMDWFNTQPPAGLDPDLEPYSALFAYFKEESEVSPGPDFEDRILQSITPVPHFQWGLVAAAAAILVVVASLFLLTPKPAEPDSKRIARVTPAAQVTDTYDNPEQALAAVRHALLVASAHLNEGRKQITNK